MEEKIANGKLCPLDDATTVFSLLRERGDTPTVGKAPTDLELKDAASWPTSVAMILKELPDQRLDKLLRSNTLLHLMNLVKSDSLAVEMLGRDGRYKIDEFNQRVTNYIEACDAKEGLTEIFPDTAIGDGNTWFQDFFGRLTPSQYKELKNYLSVSRINIPNSKDEWMSILATENKTEENEKLEIKILIFLKRIRDLSQTQSELVNQLRTRMLPLVEQIEQSGWQSGQESAATFPLGLETAMYEELSESGKALIYGDKSWEELSNIDRQKLISQYGQPVLVPGRFVVPHEFGQGAGSCLDVERSLAGKVKDSDILLNGHLLVFDTNGYIYYAIADKFVIGQDGGMIFPYVLYTVPRWLRIKKPLNYMARIMGYESQQVIAVPHVTLKPLRQLVGDSELMHDVVSGDMVINSLGTRIKRLQK